MPAEVLTEGPIRRFADAGIQAAVDKALAGLPAGQHGAVVAHADGTGASLTVMGRVGDHWSVVAGAFKPWHGKLEEEAAVVFKF